METLTREELLIISAYTGYFIGVTKKEVLMFIRKTLDRALTANDLIDRKVLAEYRGKIQYRYKAICNKLRRMAK